MSTYDWPTAWVPQAQRLRVLHNQGVSVSPLSGYLQTNTHPGSRWGWALDFPARLAADAAGFEGFITKLSGREHRVKLWDHKRPRPRGTIATTGVTTSGTTAQFATSVLLIGCGAATTLLAGDWLKFGANSGTGQLVMVTDDATADGSGIMTVSFRHMLRASVASATSVTLVNPVSTYVLTESRQEFPRVAGGAMPGVSFDFDEAWA